MPCADTEVAPLIRLCKIMTRLRAIDGCPWDAAQTPATLKPYIIEEAYELIDAIDQDDPDLIREELGDLLLQIVFQAEIHSELHLFTLQDVISGITEKLIRRHPHVFEKNATGQIDHHELRWEQIKSAEKASTGQNHGPLSTIPKHLPALQKSQKIITRLRRQHLLLGPEGKPEEMTNVPLPVSLDSPEESIAHELFLLVQKAVQLGIDAEDALRIYNNRIQLMHDQ